MVNFGKNLYDERYSQTLHKLYDVGHAFFLRRPENSELLKLLSPKKNERILEIGCNTGTFLKQISGKCKTYGADINPSAIKTAKKSDKKTVYGVMPASNLKFSSGFFDKVFSMHCLEHTDKPSAVLRETGRVLKRGGTAIFLVPFEHIRGQYGIFASLCIYSHPFKAQEYHKHAFRPADFVKFSKETGMKLEKLFVMLFGTLPVEQKWPNQYISTSMIAVYKKP